MKWTNVISFTLLVASAATIAAMPIIAFEHTEPHPEPDLTGPTLPSQYTDGSTGREWKQGEGFIPENHRLIGIGCGSDRLTYTAQEEDEFPAPCYAVGTPDNLCPSYDGGYPPDLPECVAYLGDGW